jgi:serine/threonine protein kinase
LTPSNVLLQISSLDGLPEYDVINLLGEPEKTKVVTESGEPPTEPSAPKYLVYPVIWDSVDRIFLSTQPCIIDFGDSFEIGDPPETLGIPGPYRSPELMLENTVGIGCDLWALGCTIFEIRTGRKMLNLFDDDDDTYLDALVKILGPLPEPWWSETWKMRKKCYEDKPDSQGRAIVVVPPVQEMPADYVPLPESTGSVDPSVAQDARSIQEKIAAGLWYWRGNSERIHREISDEEIEVFADLLSQLFRYKPEERPSAKDVLQHKWFKLPFMSGKISVGEKRKREGD